MRSLVGLCLLAVLAATGACVSEPGAPASQQASSPGDLAGPPPAANGEWFTDQAAAAGLDFTHFNGMSGEFYQPEIMAPGVALFDYDNDGDLDVYLVQSDMLGAGTPLLPRPPGPPGARLYRNDLSVAPDGTRTLHFTDVTAGSGLEAPGYGMGVAAGDIDNDGWVDLYVTGFGRNAMFHNNGDGTFTDVSARSGTGDRDSWGVPATFLDFDRDGRLDLFVGNYLNYSLRTHTPCFGASGAPDYCRPSVYRPQPNRLYHNLGDGRFADVTLAAGMGFPLRPRARRDRGRLQRRRMGRPVRRQRRAGKPALDQPARRHLHQHRAAGGRRPRAQRRAESGHGRGRRRLRRRRRRGF